MCVHPRARDPFPALPQTLPCAFAMLLEGPPALSGLFPTHAVAAPQLVFLNTLQQVHTWSTCLCGPHFFCHLVFYLDLWFSAVDG